jgi:perosamine synthetase
MQVPITKVEFDSNEEKALIGVLRSGWIMQGPKVAEFEKAFAAYVGSKEAVAVSSCTTALHLALVVLGIGRGDEVIAPSLSFIATANSVLYCGATVRFADIDERTFNANPDSIKAMITSRTKAIMPVDQIGLPCDYEKILTIAKDHNIPVVADSACALGAEFSGRRVGSIARLHCFSFHPRKIITSGEGGMITTNEPELAAKLRVLRSQGMHKSTFERQGKTVSSETFSELGFNYRMTDLQAAIGIEQLKKLDSLIDKRRKLAARYNEALSQIKGILIPAEPKGLLHTYQSYMILITSDARLSRDDVLHALVNEGIGAKASVQAIHLEPLYKKLYGEIKLPATERAFKEALILPLYPSMAPVEQDFVITKIKALLG